MDRPSYTPRDVAEALNVPPRALQGHLVKSSYTPEDLFSLRAKLGRFPSSVGRRKQLFLNFKGGTGKTSLSTSYAFRLAEMGYQVLLIDLDSQGHATKCLGYDGDSFPRTMLDVLVRRVPIDQVIWKTPFPTLDFVPSNLAMSAVDLSMMPLPGRELRLRNALKGIQSRYDMVVMDAPPSFGLLNLNAVLAADDLIVPALPDFLSFHGVKLLFETVTELQNEFSFELANILVVVNGFNAGIKLDKEALEAFQTHYRDFLAPTVIRQCSRFAQAASEGRPIFLADRYCKGSEDIQGLIHDVLLRLLAVDGRRTQRSTQSGGEVVPFSAPAQPLLRAVRAS